MHDFVPPVPQENQIVRWFPPKNCDPDRPGSSDVAIVCSCGKRMVTVVLITGDHRGKRYDARHISDPKLKLNTEQRADGAWEFLAEDIRRREWEAKIEGQIAALRLNLGRKNAREAKEELVSQE